MKEQMNLLLILWDRWDRYYPYFPYFAMIKTRGWWCYVACSGSRGWCVGELRIDILSVGLGPVSLPCLVMPFSEWEELRSAIKRKVRKTRCCHQGDSSGLEVREPQRNIGFERVSSFPLFISATLPFSLPALSPNSWGSLLPNHTRRVQGPLEPGGGNQYRMSSMTEQSLEQVAGSWWAPCFLGITAFLPLPAPPSPASQNRALLLSSPLYQTGVHQALPSVGILEAGKVYLAYKDKG